MNASLDSLVTNFAAEGPSEFKILRQCMGETHSDLLLRKGVFSYSHMTDESKFHETQLSPKTAFYNDLTENHITDEDYTHAQAVLTAFDMTCMKQYYNLYLETDDWVFVSPKFTELSLLNRALR